MPSSPPVKLTGAWLDCPETEALAAMFRRHNYTARFVGGVVRNALIGRPISDLDVATDARPETVMRIAEEAGFKAVGTGLKHGTVTIVVRGHIYEVTTLRVDVETHGRHATVAFTDDWEQDAARRDFTMNALYADMDGTLFDPLNGYPDLVAGRVRFIRSPEDRIREDYLRILRFFRFTAQYGRDGIDKEGLDACVMLRGGLAGLSAERIRSELVRLLATERALELLHIMLGYGLLLCLTKRVPHLKRFSHWLMLEKALELSRDPIHRLGALCVLTREDVSGLYSSLRLSNDEASKLALWTLQTPISPTLDQPAVRRLHYQYGKRFAALVAIHWLRSGDDPGDSAWRHLYGEVRGWQPPAFPIQGKDLIALGHKPGPSLGQTLQQLEQRWIDSDFSLQRDDLLGLQ